MLFLFGFHLIEQGIQALEAALPKLAIAFQPLIGLGKRLGFEAARPALRVAIVRNQAGSLQYLEVLRDRRLSHLKRLG